LFDTNYPNYFPGYGSPFAVMCPATDFWERKISGVVSKLLNEYNVDGVYVDQIGAATPRYCFVESHNHSLGNGFWKAGYDKMLSYASKSNIQKPIVTEENAEIYMSSISGYLNLVQLMDDQSIPVFPAVYGGYYIGFGGFFEQFDFYPDSSVFNCKVTALFLWGAQMGWFSIANTINVFEFIISPEYKTNIDYFIKLIMFRQETIEYFAYGRMLQPLKKKIVNQDKIPLAKGTFRSFPLVQSAVWTNQFETSLAVFIINSASYDFEWNVKFRMNLLKDYNFDCTSGCIVNSIDEFGIATLVSKINNNNFEFQLDNMSQCWVESLKIEHGN